MLPQAKGRAGFTFVEILAAMLFIALVMPVAVNAFLASNRIGVSGQRKREAAALADAKLAEAVATEAWRDGDQSGDFGEDWPGMHWELKAESWPEDTLQQVSVTVEYTVQGRTYGVTLSTLALENEEDATVGSAAAS